MDIIERNLRSAAENFRQADMHFQETEMHLQKILARLQRVSNPSAARIEESLAAPHSFEEPVPVGS